MLDKIVAAKTLQYAILFFDPLSVNNYGGNSAKG
jgi:hypothetical protein